ncbi:HD domain-containing phosphohydrolase [Ideonella sp.]|uniref:HD domain-containing phosphohydrolase n=1 Tax=Ideonella sp. TaxID=1929293 RepID=UPI002B47BE2D|nr:HD domain-containing phosphohydrolase [Ideonella sp.]HJV69012.1 HD domain-containing phosphohydrolase [Ideonella sp.]
MANAAVLRSASFSVANQHALATILEASQTKSIIASRDIFDISGIKLWARDQPVSSALQRRLLDRQLRNPLESCLLAEDGVSPHTLVQAAEVQLERGGPLVALLKPHAARLLKETGHLPLHSVPQLLLTAAQASRPEAFTHAVQAMLLCGAMMDRHGGGVAELRLALLAGLLHDLGEMYIDPRYGEAEADRELDFVSYQQLVVHPHVGHLLIAQLTNYPGALSRAIAEHHERLDGSGYPHSLQRDEVSPLGRMLAVAEAALGSLRGAAAAGAGEQVPTLARASVALRAVPGEFDLNWIGAIEAAARAEPPHRSRITSADVQARLTRLDDALRAAEAKAAELAPRAEAPPLKNAVALVRHLLGRLRLGWNASGLWSASAVPVRDAAEVEAIEDELIFRLRGIERAALLRAGELAPGDAGRLEQLCLSLRAMAE